MANADSNSGGSFSKEDPRQRRQDCQWQNLKQRIEALEEENSGIMRKINEHSQKIKQLMGVIEECKKSQEREADWLELELGSASSVEWEVSEEQEPRNGNRDLKRWVSSEEKAAFVERMGRWIVESQVRFVNLKEEEERNKNVEKEKEVVRMKKDLEEWKGKNLEMEKKIVGLESMIRERKGSGAWPTAATALAWTAVAAAMIFRAVTS